MKSNIKHFTRKSLWYFAFAMAYGAVMAAFGYEGDKSDIINWFFIGPAAMNLGTQINVLKFEVPLCLRFGSTRKNIFRGIIWYDFLNMLLPTVAIAIIAMVLNAGVSPVFMAAVTMLLVMFSQAVGGFMGIAIYKLKGIAAFFVIFAVSVIISGGVAIGVIVLRAELADLTANGITSAGPYIVAAVVFAVWALVLWIQRRMIYKYSL